MEDATRSGIRLKESEAWDLITDCCSSLQWLQETVQEHHLNIKPGNILKCKDKYKLADLYGRVETLSAYLGDARYLACSANYVAPELLHFKGYWLGLNLLKADIYSLGICVIENLVDAKCMQFGYVKLKHLLERNMQGYSPALRKTLLRMVNTDPQQRPQAAELSYISLYDADCNNSRGKELRRRNTI